ncbi:MAG TPA: 30S ribosomal protein S1 [Candidatus Brocadiia bacterium]|nr:30S ribosomal protein S1 [Candidatus Brocadiia bacterium]
MAQKTVKRDFLKENGISRDEIELEVSAILTGSDALPSRYEETVQDFTAGKILTGRVLGVDEDDVIIDIGCKSQGRVPSYEWDEGEEIKPGEKIEVLLEAVEDEGGMPLLSKRKADRIRNWEQILSKCNEGDVVTGKVVRKIKGGLLVDIGVPVFLPASQIDIRRPREIADYIGKEVSGKILKIDPERQNIVISRRRLIEEERERMKIQLLAEIQPGELRKGKVKNIADFGAFVDLGGIDGLLHITDMSWGRIGHPSEVVSIDQEIEVMVLNVDKEKEKIALGLKQKSASPWETIEEKYPVGSRVKGEAVNLVSYGAFVKLEEGVEGLVHISEMSWTRRINHPSEIVQLGQQVEVVVLGINKDKQEISLGMKQTEADPWSMVAEKYPPGTIIKGRVRNLTNYGAFVELEEGVDGLLHVSDMSWTKKVNHPSEKVKKGEEIEAVIINVDQERKRVALGLKQLHADPWEAEIPNNYHGGDIVRGHITKLTSFGAFVELEDGLEGLLHISEISDRKISRPEEIVAINDLVNVKIIRVDQETRKIGLSLRPGKVIPPDSDEPGIIRQMSAEEMAAQARAEAERASAAEVAADAAEMAAEAENETGTDSPPAGESSDAEERGGGGEGA